METHKTTAKDFFLHLGLLVSLYSGVGFLLNLLFSVINSAYPGIDSYYYTPSMSFPVAALIILTPVLLVLGAFIAKSESADPAKKDIWVKRWSTYLTMFVTGAVIVGDLITVLYFFLDGKDITTAFLLKIVAVLVVLGSVFAYFWSNLNGSLTLTKRKMWQVGAIAIVLVAIVLGFTVIGSPRTQRLLRYDGQKVADLQNIQGQVINYWQSKKTLPPNLESLKDSLSYFNLPVDPQSKEAYTYKLSEKAYTFELCATFNRDSRLASASPRISNAMYVGIENENWTYKSGNFCFIRTLDPDRYPPFKSDL